MVLVTIVTHSHYFCESIGFMNLGIIIQARKGSTRLPGKVVMPFYEDKGVLEIIIKRVVAKYPKLKTILATTSESIDDDVAKLGQSLGVEVFRGSENNVLSRFTELVKLYNLDGVIRVCADNPFLDVDSFQEFIDWGAESKADYVGFGISSTHPTIKTHFGLWAEYVSASALIKASELTQEKLFVEHVTNFIYGNPDLFKIEIQPLPNNWANEKKIRFTLDTKEDFDLLQKLYQDCILLDIKFSPTELISYVKNNPDIERQMGDQVSRWEK